MGTVSTPASSLPLVPASTPFAVWDPPSGLCLLPSHSVPGLGSLLRLSFLPSPGSQDSGPLARSPGPCSPSPVLSVTPFRQASQPSTLSSNLPMSSAQSSLASYSTEKADSSGSNMLSTALLPRPTRAPLCPTPPASWPALWTPCFSCLSPFSSGVHGPWRFKERTVSSQGKLYAWRSGDSHHKAGQPPPVPLSRGRPPGEDPWPLQLATPLAVPPPSSPQPSGPSGSCSGPKALVLAPWGRLLPHTGWRRVHSSGSCRWGEAGRKMPSVVQPLDEGDMMQTLIS